MFKNQDTSVPVVDFTRYAAMFNYGFEIKSNSFSTGTAAINEQRGLEHPSLKQHTQHNI